MIVTTLVSTDTRALNDFIVNLPAGESGDVLVIFAYSAGAGGASTPSGWTQLCTNGASTSFSYVFARETTVTGADTVTITWDTTFHKVAIVYRLRNVSLTNWAGQAATGLTSNNFAPPWGSANNLWITSLAAKTSDWTTSAPTDYGNLIEGDAQPASGSWTVGSIFTAHREVTAADQETVWPYVEGSAGPVDGGRVMIAAFENVAAGGPSHIYPVNELISGSASTTGGNT